MDQGVQHLVDHADVVVIRELLFYVGEIAHEIPQSLGEKFGHMQVEIRVLAQILSRLLDYVERRWLGRDDIGGMPGVQQRGDLAEDRTRLLDPIDEHVALPHLKRAAD